jgi:hypothetical protein
MQPHDARAPHLRRDFARFFRRNASGTRRAISFCEPRPGAAPPNECQLNRGEDPMINAINSLTRRTLQLATVLLLTAGATQAFADAPAYVRVRSITYAGSGCAAGSVAENISPDRQAFTLLFDSFMAEAGPGVPFTEKRKNCQLNVDLDFPAGWSYSIAKIDYRGYVSLDPGVRALQRASYYFQGSGQTAAASSSAVGPVDQDYQLEDVLGISALVWSPCGAQRSLNINTEVRADNSLNPAGNGLITTDSIDGTFKTIFALQWTHCY